MKSQKESSVDKARNDVFGQRRICYINFASHLLNAYNPNMYHPGLSYTWSDSDWCKAIDMMAAFGFNVFEFWLEPRLFCRDGLASEVGREFTRQMNEVIDHAHTRQMKVEMITALATVGPDWRTFCPNVPHEWDELKYLWGQWTLRFPDLDIVGIFPGDPGGCSLNGCTAETYIDSSVDIAQLARDNIPGVEIELSTWGSPFYAWGIIEGPEGWNNEFEPAFQKTAWRFDKVRMETSMTHLMRRLPDFPPDTIVGINMGFTPDGNPDGENNGIGWANEIAKTNRIQTWDFSLTEGENYIVPHYRLHRLFEQRRAERAAAPYSGGICFTMTPKLNALSLYASAVSFQRPDADLETVAGDFFEMLFGNEGRRLVDYAVLFEVLGDWGCHVNVPYERKAYHARMTELTDLLESLGGSVRGDVPLFPDPESYRQELLWFARTFRDFSGPVSNNASVRDAYWRRVYAVYDQLPKHVDPRPRGNTDRIAQFFREA